MASPDPSQSGERIRGRWPGEVRACPVGPGCSALYRIVTDDYAGPALLQKKWVSLLQGTDTYVEDMLLYKEDMQYSCHYIVKF